MSPLHQAVYFGQKTLTRLLIRLGANIEATNPSGDTPLLIATQRRHTGCVQTLIAAGADIHATNNNGDTPLISAARQGHLACLEILIAAGAELNSRNQYALLSLAINSRSVACLKRLISAGAGVNIKQHRRNWSSTPLIYAATVGNRACVQALINAGADVDTEGRTNLVSLPYIHFEKTTPLSCAAAEGNTECLQLLITAGAKINTPEKHSPLLRAVENGHADCVKELLLARPDMSQRDSEGRTALGIAIKNGKTECLQALLSAGVDPDQKQRNGKSPLAMAAAEGDLGCLQALIAAGANIHSFTYFGYDTTPLLQATLYHRNTADCMQALIDAGADVNESRSEPPSEPFYAHNISPLYSATKYKGEAKYLNILLKAGALVNHKNSKGQTPLFAACHWYSTECLEVLLAAGAQVNIQDNKCLTPLLTAAWKQNEPCVKALIHAGANVNQALYTNLDAEMQAALDRSAYLCAYDLGRSTCLEVLIAAGVDPNIQGLPGHETFYYSNLRRLINHAIYGNNPDALSILISAGADVNFKDGCSPLETAILSKDISCLKILIAAGANIHGRPGDPPLLYTALKEKQTACIKALILAGANIYSTIHEDKSAHDLAPGKLRRKMKRWAEEYDRQQADSTFLKQFEKARSPLKKVSETPSETLTSEQNSSKLAG